MGGRKLRNIDVMLHPTQSRCMVQIMCVALFWLIPAIVCCQLSWQSAVSLRPHTSEAPYFELVGLFMTQEVILLCGVYSADISTDTPTAILWARLRLLPLITRQVATTNQGQEVGLQCTGIGLTSTMDAVASLNKRIVLDIAWRQQLKSTREFVIMGGGLGLQNVYDVIRMDWLIAVDKLRLIRSKHYCT